MSKKSDHDLLVELKTDLVWVKRIIIGAASLGFVEKIVGWIFGR